VRTKNIGVLTSRVGMAFQGRLCGPTVEGLPELIPQKHHSIVKELFPDFNERGGTSAPGRRSFCICTRLDRV